MRLVQDLMNNQRPESGLFFGTLGSTRLGNVDVMYDPSAREQILVGQVANSGGRTSFDLWCSFESRCASYDRNSRFVDAGPDIVAHYFLLWRNCRGSR